MTTEEIIDKITSRDIQNIREASCEIINLGLEREKILPLQPYLSLIKEKTSNLDMGGAFALNKRFVDFALQTIEFYKNSTDKCPCELYVTPYLSTDDPLKRTVKYECFNPNKEVEKRNIKILDIVKIENKWVDYYLVECLKCGQRYKVLERDYHYTWWDWEKIK